MSINVMVRVRKVVNAHRTGRLLVSCEDAFRIAEELLAAREALKAQVASTRLFGKRLGLTDTDLDLGTSQARAALGEVARNAMSAIEVDVALANYLEKST